MRFLVDAQLPRSLCLLLAAKGFDALHTLELAEKNKTPDAVITEIADLDARIVITKDADFMDAHLLHGKPEKLVMVSTGNIRNSELLAIFETHFAIIADLLKSSSLIEVGRQEIISHKSF